MAALNLLLLTLGLAFITLALLLGTPPDTALAPTLATAARTLRGAGGALLVLGGVGLCIALWRAVQQRRDDLALLRLLGAPPGRLAGLVVGAALWLTALASALGLMLGHGLAHALGAVLHWPITGLAWQPAEAGVPLLAVCVNALAALVPAVQAYRTDVASLLRQP